MQWKAFPRKNKLDAVDVAPMHSRASHAVRNRRRVIYVSSFTVLLDPLVLHEAMPFSIAELDEYISLLPMV